MSVSDARDSRDRRFISFITCFDNESLYARCRESIARLMSPEFDVEIVPVDNTTQRYASPAALNFGRSQANGEWLVFCHQDITFPKDWLTHLTSALTALQTASPPWAVAGPIGRAGKRFYGHIEDAEGTIARFEPLPSLVDTLDECCLVIRADLPFAFDEHLGGHHLYGVDLCLQITEAGYGAYAIDVPCHHASSTVHRPPEYHHIKRKLQRKWRFARRRVASSIGTTCGRIRLAWYEGWI